MRNEDFLFKLCPGRDDYEKLHFVFYDNHPQDNKKIDIIICTPEGEVIEYYKCEIIYSIFLKDVREFRGIRILRNSKCHLFYLVETSEHIIILSRKDCLEINETIRGVTNFEISDPMCLGVEKICISTWNGPVTLDDNFRVVDESGQSFLGIKIDPKPVQVELMRKLREANYNLKSNREAHKKLKKLRQGVAYSLYDRLTCNPSNLLPSTSSSTVGGMLLNVVYRGVRFCNKKFVIMLEVRNVSNELLDKVHLLIHNNHCNSLSYKCKIFETSWKELESLQLKKQQQAYIATVIPITEFRHAVSSKIEVNVLVTYENKGVSYLKPCKSIYISAGEVIHQNFGVFSSNENENEQDDLTVLALLSTSVKTTVCLRFIQRHENQARINPIAIFCEHLKMEIIDSMCKTIVHKNSPLHILHATTVIFDDTNDATDSFTADVYTRSVSQVMALIHYIQCQIPCRIIVTTPDIQITPDDNTLTRHLHPDEVVVDNTGINYAEYKTLLLQQTNMTLDYLSLCKTVMNVSKNPAFRNKVGKEINIFAQGFDKFEEYRKRMIEKSECVIMNSHIELNDAIEID